MGHDTTLLGKQAYWTYHERVTIVGLSHEGLFRKPRILVTKIIPGGKGLMTLHAVALEELQVIS